MIEEVLLSLLTNVIVFYAGYRWGLHQAIMRLISNYVNNPGELDKAFKQLAQLNSELNELNDHIDITAEWHGDNVYLYRKDTHEFMGQGKNVDEAMKQVTLQQGIEYRIPEEMATKPK